MDSLSQAVLGGMVGVLVTRGRQPRKAIICGALLATLPDLDILQPFDNDLEATINHRTWSHSWIIHLCVSPFLAVILHRLDRSWSWFTWFGLVLVVLTSHAALDAFTIYGTSLFWPLQSIPTMGGSIFIIDPLYTLPLLVTTIMVWRRPKGHKLNRIAGVGIVLSSLYICWGLLAQNHVEKLAAESMENQGVSWQKMIATPSPFNSVLWRILVLQEDSFLEGFYAFTDSSNEIQLHSYPRNLVLRNELDNQTDIDSFARFNHGYYSLARINDEIVASDLRMGAEPYYFFRFVFADSSAIDGELTGSEVRSPGMLVPRFANIPIDEWHFFSWLGKRLVSSRLDPLSRYSSMDAVAAPEAGGI